MIWGYLLKRKDNNTEVQPTKSYGSVRNQMMTWFLITSLFPLILVSYFGYQLASNTLKDLVVENLESTSGNMFRSLIIGLITV